MKYVIKSPSLIGSLRPSPKPRRWAFKQIIVGATASLASLPANFAHCPLCTAATAATVAVGRFYGVDDELMGILIGGFIVSTALWANNACKRRGWNFLYQQDIALVLAALIMTIAGFQIGGLFTSAVLWSIPRLLTGMLIGTAVTVIGNLIHQYLREVNDGRNYIALQGMSIMLAALLIACAFVVGGSL